MATCTINSQEYSLPSGLADTTLLEWLREQGLTGTKLGCGEGGCGACTVMVSSKSADGGVEHKAVNACLCPAYSVIGCSVTTVEGIGNNKDGLHPVQERLANAHGSQCGFCTPGFVMSMYALLQNKPVPTVPDIEDALAGNLCRCTGYRPILDAFLPFTKANGSSAATPGAEGKLKAAGRCQRRRAECMGASKQALHACVNVSGTCAAESNCKGTAVPAMLSGAQATWHRCETLEELLQCKARQPAARIMGGNTEVGIEMHIKGAAYAVLIDATRVPELQVLEEAAGGSLLIGGGVTLSKLLERCVTLQATKESGKPGVLGALEKQLRLFAGVQIRNVATVAGNVVTASPISDLNPVWVAAGAEFHLQSTSGPRTVAAKSFFLGYRKADIKPEEVLVAVKLPFTAANETMHAFKQAHRRDDDIAIVNAAIRLKCAPPATTEACWSIKEADVAYGGVGPTVLACPATAAALKHQSLTLSTVQAALESVRADVNVAEGAPGGMEAYRNTLARSFLFKALVAAALHVRNNSDSAAAKSALEWAVQEQSAAQPLLRGAPEGVQFHAAAAPDAIVGQALQHRAADLQVCGHAKYTDDMDLPPHTLHAALVPSPVPHGRLLGIDSSAAERLPGVHGVFSAKDVPGKNETGAVFMDEHVFAVDELTCVGQVVAVVVAESAPLAIRAARLVEVLHEALPPVMSIDDAVAAGQYHPQYERTLLRGDVDAALAGADVAAVVEGDVRMGGQEHFYLEPHCNFVQPIENDEFLLVASTQDVTKHQKLCAKTLGIPQHKLVSKTKRLGGGFGGKETRSAFLHCAVAVAAYHLQQPVKLVLPRQHDMQMTGHRHAFMGRYKVAAAADGRILALDLQLYCNAGNSVDLSHAIMDRAVLHSDCGFHIPAVRITGQLCRTNQASNTAFRGFGGPQGMLVANTWMDALAHKLAIPLDTIQERNLYVDGAATHFGQKLEHSQLRTCWSSVLQSSAWPQRRQAVDAFNCKSRHRKRGLAVLPTKFGISFTFKPMNQAGALVSIFLDGSVSVTHGGVEMGQGLHTKMCQIAAAALKSVHIAETSTDKVPNSSPTAASASSDLYGAAIMDACTQLNERLAPLREKLGEAATMGDIAAAAWMDRVDLCAHGFYKTPDITGTDGDMPFNYFVYGAAVCEAEVDCLTGDWHVPRCDIVMDVGNPINPAIDIGQVEGGFVQGMGWACMEELKWGDKAHPWVKPGALMTNGPGAYKIPTVNDVPVDFRVTLLRNAPNARAVHSSKAVGEPPFHLGASVLFAIKDAVYACREQTGLTGFFDLDAPCTPERIRMACAGPLCSDSTGSTRPALSC